MAFDAVITDLECAVIHVESLTMTHEPALG
jgi:hypothetical protein